MQKEVLVEIKPNETAFLLPLEGSTDDQAKFSSMEYLQEKKVAGKRVSLAQRKYKTGRKAWNYKWITTEVVVIVDRAPVSREWTPNSNTGTSGGDQSFIVESSNSIVFRVGASITARIKEEDTALFLYTYAGKDLGTIMDTNVRNRASDLLATEFGKYDLDGCREGKGEVFAATRNASMTEFAEFGLTISQFGLVGGLNYENTNIQTKIDEEFEAQNQIKINQYHYDANQIDRKDKRKTADNQLYIAQKYAQALKAEKQKTELEIRQTYADAFKISAEKGNNVVPNNIVPEGSNFLYNPDLSGK